MNTLDPKLALPDGASAEAQKAHAAILAVLEKHDMTHTGGCHTFYLPDAWKQRGEHYGHNSILVVVHDGGDVAPFFNWDYECYALVEDMRKALEAIGMFPESQTCWYSAIYPIRPVEKV